MQHGKAAHGDTDHVRAVDLEMVEHREDVIARMILGVARGIVRDVGGRKPARRKGDAAEVAREEAQLRLPAAVVAGELVDEDERMAASRFVKKKAGAILRGGVGHFFP